MHTRTTSSLLEDLADPANEAVWREFDERLRPVLIGIGRRGGLRPEDAADAAQETLARFVRAYREGKYDRTRGRLRSWLIGIARHCIVEILTERARGRDRRGPSGLEQVPGADEMEAWWDVEAERTILSRAMRELREGTRTDPRTVRAFDLLAFDRRSPAEVAEELGMSMNDVYLAKHRCLRRLREIVARLDEAYERDG